MRIKMVKNNAKIWLSAKDTYNWANKPGSKWPCSQLSGKRLFAEFQDNDLVYLTINGRIKGIENNEFNAIISDLVGIYDH